jgi:predicted Abi (CAAX) family protease
VLHFNRDERAFVGREDVVEMPPIVPDLDERPNSVTRGIERSPLNAEGWYVGGAFRPDGRFVVQALVPRALLRVDGERAPLKDARAAYHYARHDAWRELAAARGGTIAAESESWRLGDSGLVVHTYGGIGGKNREAAAAGPIYFGHFAYGRAQATFEPLSGETVLEVTYYQVYTQNGDGLTAGALDWSRYVGDRQFGWLGVRPVCDAIVRLEPLTRVTNRIDGRRGTSALDAIVRQLEVMTARYRIGDGTGGTFVGAANNCAQDSNHALFAALRSPEFARDEALAPLAKDLKKKLQLFGAPRRDWSRNVYNLGTTMEDAPLQNLITALGSWRCILPRLAFNTIVGAFLRHGAALTILGTDQAGGERNDIAPVAPSAF